MKRFMYSVAFLLFLTLFTVTAYEAQVSAKENCQCYKEWSACSDRCSINAACQMQCNERQTTCMNACSNQNNIAEEESENCTCKDLVTGAEISYVCAAGKPNRCRRVKQY